MAKNILSAVKERARSYIENNTLAQNILHSDLTKEIFPRALTYAHTVKVISLPDVSEKGHNIKPKLEDKILSKALDGRENCPLMVVSISGEFRSGKSFFLNLMTTYLNHLQSQGNSDEWLNSNLPIKGIAWARSKEAVTNGVWMWSDPFLLQRKDGSQISVLLLDCQGTGDVRQSNTTLDTLITYISLQMSNVQIVNLKGQMTSDDLCRLKMCTSYAEALTEEEAESSETGSSLFDRLVYLQRNWECDENYGKQPEKDFEDLISDSRTSEEVKQAGKGIMQAFRKVSTYALPHPGPKVTKSDEEDYKSGKNRCLLHVSDIESEFLDAAKELFDEIFCNQDEDRHLPLGSVVIDEFEKLGHRIRESGFSISSPEASLKETLAYRAFNAAIAFFDTELKKVITDEFMNSEPPTIETRAKFDEVWSATKDIYDKKYGLNKFGVTEAYGRFLGILDQLKMVNLQKIEQQVKAVKARNQAKKKTKLAQKFKESIDRRAKQRREDYEVIRLEKNKLEEEVNSKAEKRSVSTEEMGQRESENKNASSSDNNNAKNQTVTAVTSEPDNPMSTRIAEDEEKPPRPSKSVQLRKETKKVGRKEKIILLQKLASELQKTENEMKEAEEKAKEDYERKVAAAKEAEKKAAKELKKAHALAEEELNVRRGNPFLKGLKKVGLGIAGLAAGLVGIATAPLWVPPLAVYVMVTANESNEELSE